MPVDVRTEIDIARPRAQVAAYVADPTNATAWYENIESIEWETAPPVAVGSRMAFVARFLGRRLAYTYEVVEHDPGRRFVMRTAEGPFPMETTYEFSDAPDGTRMTLRNRGEPSGFARVTAPVMERAMRRANRKDLERLRAILEGDLGYSLHMAKDHGKSVKNDKQYEGLREKGMSKSRAAAISNANAGSDNAASKKGGKNSSSGSGSSQSSKSSGSGSGGNRKQKQAAGRKGGKAAAGKS